MYLQIWEFRKATEEEKEVFKRILKKTNKSPGWYDEWDLAYNVVDKTYLVGAGPLPFSFKYGDQSDQLAMDQLNRKEFDLCRIVKIFRLTQKPLPTA